VPPWFAGAMEQILTETMAPIRADIQIMKEDIQVMKNDIQVMKGDIRDMKGDIQVMKGDIRAIKTVQGQVWKLAARVSNVSPLIFPLMTNSKDHNLSAGAGDDARFEVVPFTNGRDPTKDPVSFYLLSHLSMLRADALFCRC
jgi:hypothetical protein